MTLSDLHGAKYIALETFRKNGQGVKTPVWQVPERDNLYVWTAADSWKVKRIRNNDRVRVCESDWRGTPLSGWVEAHALILDNPGEEKEQRRRLATKYGWQFWLFYLFAKLSGANYVAIKISPASVRATVFVIIPL